MPRNNELDHFSAAAAQESIGYVAYKDMNLATTSPINLFTVTGKVLITLLHGEVTTVLATTTTVTLQRETGTVAMCAATTITSDAVGTMYMWSGDAGAILNGTLAAGDAPVVGLAHLSGGPQAPMVFGLAGATENIECATDQAGTGVIRWYIHWKPLLSGSKVVAA